MPTITPDALVLIDELKTDLESASVSFETLIEKEKWIDSSNAHKREDKLRVLQNKLEAILTEVNNIYS